MNRFRAGHILPAAFIFLACHHNPAGSAEAVPGADTPVKKNFFPVRNFLKSQISYVDSFPLRLMEYDTQNGKTDSAFISTKKFDQLAAAFLPEDLDSSRFEKRFEESSFYDQSTKKISFTYSTKDALFGLRRVDVLAEPDPAGDKVKSVYMEVSSGNADSLVLHKMLWQTGKSFSILRIYQPGPGRPVSSQTRVVWDNSE